MHQTTEDTYWEQGFLNGIDIFSKDEINECQKHFDKLEARVGRETCQVGLINSHFQEQFVWEMATNSKLLDLMQTLMGEDLMLLGSHFFCKYPVESTEHFVAWHQDVTYWGLKPPEAHTAWIAVDDSDLENGCMRVIPGSHKMGLSPHSESEAEGNLLSINQEIPQDQIREEDAQDLCLKAGQVSVHEGLLVHSSSPNRSTRRRCGLTVRFVKPEIRQSELNSHQAHWSPVLLRGQDTFRHFPEKAHPFPIQ
ncbi:MAG: phytanoyl-CoA dioxygenase family protein [SAR324 cluster bacterium]|jgi:ectoine hydroxylase-related dioxygenase (phytanoyl-CoA dioxygenase family)|nr:hypothetical protein [Deltaproteobacteria bacterium]MDP6247823.1 phytanoyl-CoA dioxygenase family protein [SAR324 cluster bacterium]MDP7140406.1 phytanoyl-CoA dioxygenase family protein [SAR324 cluster bacterium]MDP7335821.1 phytanoyl-CoA dioxygenase family protein [SAR324 cluster bacterium]MDP7501743.1 phytanoyl-CoA dioxygenase family protein [SAR324 cluster bacterium]|tara:strand:- start:4074 stop:4829 length:756 start_codon:yes stop_codon:yes gene_type:complete